MISRINSAVLNGLDVVATEVEVGFSRGIPGIVIVGLPDNAVKESRERLKLAVTSANFDYPQATKIVINLSPADVRKEGSALDLPMAVGIVKNRYRLESPAFADLLFYGELNLNGDLNPVKGVLNIALFAREQGLRGIVIPYENRLEAQFVRRHRGLCPEKPHPGHRVDRTSRGLRPLPFRPWAADAAAACEDDFSEIKGQYLAKRAMEIAAAGFHNVLMIGAPGSGKSMISKALPSILPDMSDDEILETSLIYSAAGLLGEKGGLVRRRPFRSPHHTISDVGISGGGKYPVPGEISLAHNGVLFLDEIPYFKRSALEVLRQPLEDGKITVSRSLTSSTFPARFMLVAAMNPSQDAVGLGESSGGLSAPAQKRRYYSKLSRPLLDRIDLQLEVKKLKLDEITSTAAAESSAVIRRRVVRARDLQTQRFRGLKKKIFANGQMRNPEIKKFCPLDESGDRLLRLRRRPLRPERPRLFPHPESGPHHRRPAGRGKDRGAPRAGSAAVQVAGPGAVLMAAPVLPGWKIVRPMLVMVGGRAAAGIGGQFFCRPAAAAFPGAGRGAGSGGPAVHFSEVDADFVQAIGAGSGTLLLDARAAAAYRLGHIPGAVSLPLAEFAMVFPRLAGRLREARMLVAYCSGPNCNDSRDLALRLWERGLKNLLLYKGGMEDWNGKGHVLER